MMSASESAVIFNMANRGRDPQSRTVQWTLSAYTAAVVEKLRDLAPYAALELVLPGGSLMAFPVPRCLLGAGIGLDVKDWAVRQKKGRGSW